MTDTPFFDANEFLDASSWKMRFEFERLTTQIGVNDTGVPKFKETDIIKVFIPTDTGHPDIVPAMVDEYCSRHPEARNRVMPAYEKWKQNQEQPMDGYPLKHVQGIPPSVRKQFEYVGIITAEQLIDAGETVVNRVIDGKKYQAAVKRLMDVSEKKSEAAKLTKELDDLKAQNLALQKQMEKLAEAAGKKAA